MVLKALKFSARTGGKLFADTTFVFSFDAVMSGIG